MEKDSFKWTQLETNNQIKLLPTPAFNS